MGELLSNGIFNQFGAGPWGQAGGGRSVSAPNVDPMPFAQPTFPHAGPAQTLRGLAAALGTGGGPSSKTPGGFAGVSPTEPAPTSAPTSAPSAIPTPDTKGPQIGSMPQPYYDPASLFGRANSMMANMPSAAPASFDYSSILKQAPGMMGQREDQYPT